MKANKVLDMNKDTRAQIGIGTLIIFIAMVLIAAVAASVLIQTSGTLQQQAQSTGKQATQEVSSNLVIKSIEGVRARTSDNLSSNVSLLKIKVALNVGSSPVDLNQLVISITDGVNTNNLLYGYNEKTYASPMSNFSSSASYDTNLGYLLNGTQSNPGTNGKYFFTAQKIRDEDKSFSQGDPIMTTGDLVTIYVSAASDGDLSYNEINGITTSGTQKDSNLDIGTRTTVSMVLTPEAGATTIANFVTPTSFGTKETIALYP